MEAPCRRTCAALVACLLGIGGLTPVLALITETPKDGSQLQVPAGTKLQQQIQAVQDNDPQATIQFAVTLVTPSSPGLFTISSNGGLTSTRELQTSDGFSGSYVVRINLSSIADTKDVIYVVTAVANTESTPVFRQTSGSYGYDAYVRENAPPLTVVKFIDAFVPSEGPASLQLDPPSAIFSFASQNLTLLVGNKLDREMKPLYNLTVVATDKSGKKINRTQVFVHILDVNDNIPMIVPGQTGYLYSTEPANVDVMTVKYTDEDIGNNSAATFWIVSGNIDNTFRINSDTGTISTTKPVLNLPDTLNLTIYLTDRGVPPRSSTGLVHVKLIRVNNSEPFFIGTPYTAYIIEDTVVGSFIFQALANDTDPQEAGELQYSLSSVPQENGKNIFSINPGTGQITLQQSVDYEFRKIYSFVVTVTDKEVRQPKSASVNMTVYVLDVNDNSPMFEKSSYVFDITENLTVGYTLITLINGVNDADSGSNKQLTFGIYPPIDTSFSVNSNTGAVQLAKPLSRKAQHLYTLYVYAADGGIPQRRANATITINVIEVNNVEPTMVLPSQYSLYETNGTQVNIPFLVVNITNRDGGPAGNVSLEILKGNTSVFGVQEYGYGIFYKRPLNYEELGAKSWMLQLRAVDHGDPRKFTDGNITLTLNDYNEFSPVFSQTSYTGGVDLSSTIPAGTQIVLVSATDADRRDNTITYKITSGQRLKEFIINENSGLITSGSYPITKTTVFNLTVTATDNGSPFHRNSSVMVYITVKHSTNVNDPKFVKTLFQIILTEETPKGTFMAQVSATDSDQGEAGIVHYVLLSGAPDFTLNKTTGEVFTNTLFDYEKGCRVFKVLVNAEDNGIFRPRRSAIPATITVHINNTNDQPPSFTLPPYILKCKEFNDLVNGFISYNPPYNQQQASQNQTATFFCRKGYQLAGEANAVCHGNGQWSATDPICEKIEQPPTSDNKASTGLTAGLSVAGFLFLVAGVAAIYLYTYHCKAQSSKSAHTGLPKLPQPKMAWPNPPVFATTENPAYKMNVSPESDMEEIIYSKGHDGMPMHDEAGDGTLTYAEVDDPVPANAEANNGMPTSTEANDDMLAYTEVNEGMLDYLEVNNGKSM